VLNAVYAAVRDQNWTTVPFSMVQETLEEHKDGFSIGMDLEYAWEENLYRARMTIDANGHRLSVEYEGTAESTFLRNRIGLCILHPISECRGRAVTLIHPDGSHSEGLFPEFISPDQPLLNLAGMQWTPGNGITARLSFEGEIFESEDQRNWTDASYKTYGTPLENPFPVQVNKGDHLSQSVILQAEQDAASDQHMHARPSETADHISRTLSLTPGQGQPLPGLGIARTTEPVPMTPGEAEILKSLRFHHYRVDLKLDHQDWKEVYDSAFREQLLLDWPLELALHFGRQADRELERFRDHYALHPATIRHMLVFDEHSLSPNELLKQVVPRLRAFFPEIQVGAGTDANFAELNRNPPDPAGLDFVSYSICPQVHAFDNLTLLENLAAQRDSVLSAANLLSKPVSIGALTLKQRFNAVATEENEASLTPESDPRQHTIFAAGWTLGSLRNLVLAAPVSVTYYETTGPRGILSRKFPPNTQPPLYHLFRELLSSGSWQIIPTESSHPLEFEGLAMRNEKEIRVFIANHTDQGKRVHLNSIPGEVRSCSRLGEQGWQEVKNEDSPRDILLLEPVGIYLITCSL